MTRAAPRPSTSAAVARARQAGRWFSARVTTRLGSPRQARSQVVVPTSAEGEVRGGHEVRQVRTGTVDPGAGSGGGLGDQGLPLRVVGADDQVHRQVPQGRIAQGRQGAAAEVVRVGAAEEHQHAAHLAVPRA